MISALKTIAHSIPLITGAVFAGAAILDFLYYRLPNKLFYVIFYLFPLYIILSCKFYLVSNYLVFVGSILVGLGLFSTNVMGGGDVKLLSAISLWMGWDQMIFFLVWMIILGGLIACLYLLLPYSIHQITAQCRDFIRQQPFLKRGIRLLVPDIDIIEREIISLQAKRMIPYGISIAGAGLFTLIKGTL